MYCVLIYIYMGVYVKRERDCLHRYVKIYIIYYEVSVFRYKTLLAQAQLQ